jgi:predicted nucleic acid-binding protein
MADRCFDTSAIAKHYRAEAGTQKVDALLAEAGARHLISALSVVELHSIFARLVRTGQITGADFNLARGRFLADIASGLWQVTPVTDIHFHHAQQLLVQHGLSHGLRTLDALQLAIALSLNAVGPLDGFVCADANLCHIAAAEGLVVVNPEAP